MSLDWQIQHRWGSHNHKLTPFLAISLLLHGAVFLGLAIYWHGRSVNHLLQSKPNTPLPVKFIDLPPEKAAVKPSPNAKYSASRNSRAGGPFRRDLPAMIGRLGTSRSIPKSSSPPSRVQAKSSIPHPPQPEKLLPSQPTPVKVSPPQAADSVASLKPRRQTSKQASPPASPIARSTEQPLPPASPIARSIEKPPTSEPVMRHPDANPLPSPKPTQPSERLVPRSPTNPVVKHTQYLPNTSRLAFNRRSDSSNTSVPPTEHIQNRDRSSLPQQSRSVTEGEQHSQTSNRLAFNRPSISGAPTTTSQLSQKSHNQLPSWQQASSLGGTVSLPSHNFRGGGDNLSNANRLAFNSAGVDTRQDDLGPYLQALKQRVAQQWRHENPGSSKHTVIFFAVNRNGQITPPRLVRTSGSAKIDQAALEAVEHAAPFAPLPESFREAQLSIEFTFNIFDIDLSQP
ncbi:MAG: TonB family protein [Chroococcidiopsidaceae cyanobacterium CP_BM_ER_R8_30]|nr:TonB family protein [Chroococcidiopsidaceae cyanobacterium CP_BM_ER_R8_30]